MDNTLFLGNGFSLALFENIPSWEKLISFGSVEVKNYSILYEIELNKSSKNEEEFKTDLSAKLSTTKLKSSIEKLSSIAAFGNSLAESNINNIITTNFDDGVSEILVNYCGYEFQSKDESETTYSIHRYSEYLNKTTNHKVKIWKIHGDISKPKTMQLGLNHYGEFLSKIQSYVDGSYLNKEKKKKIKHDSIESKLNNGEYSINSWIDLMFSSNVYIAGFGMSFIEIDLWWLLVKRLRLKKVSKNISNKICYINSQKHGNIMNNDIKIALVSVDVEVKSVDRTDDFFKDTFDIIDSKTI